MCRGKPLTQLAPCAPGCSPTPRPTPGPRLLTWAGGGLLADPRQIPMPSRKSPAVFWPWDSKQLTPCLMMPGSTSFTGTLRGKMAVRLGFCPPCWSTQVSVGRDRPHQHRMGVGQGRHSLMWIPSSLSVEPGPPSFLRLPGSPWRPKTASPIGPGWKHPTFSLMPPPDSWAVGCRAPEQRLSIPGAPG